MGQIHGFPSYTWERYPSAGRWNKLLRPALKVISHILLSLLISTTTNSSEFAHIFTPVGGGLEISPHPQERNSSDNINRANKQEARTKGFLQGKGMWPLTLAGFQITSWYRSQAAKSWAEACLHRSMLVYQAAVGSEALTLIPFRKFYESLGLTFLHWSSSYFHRILTS